MWYLAAHISSIKSYFKSVSYVYWKTYPSFQGFSLIVQLLFTLPVGLVVGKNTLIDDRPPPAAADRLGKTMNSGSPQSQKSDIQEENEDISQTHKRYHFQNCGTVYMDSRNVRMENCGNHIPQVTSSYLIFFVSFLITFAPVAILVPYYYLDHGPGILVNEKVLHSQFHTASSGMWALAPSAMKRVEYVFPSLGPQNATGSRTAPFEIVKSNSSNVYLRKCKR